jgi:hypothetical protein
MYGSGEERGELPPARLTLKCAANLGANSTLPGPQYIAQCSDSRLYNTRDNCFGTYYMYCRMRLRTYLRTCFRTCHRTWQGTWQGTWHTCHSRSCIHWDRS